MDLILDGEAQRLDTTDCANLAELVARAESHAAPLEASVVVSVEVDGRRLSPDEMTGLEAHPIEGVARVAIERRPTRVVACSVLEQGADYTNQITAAIDHAVEGFRASRSTDGNQLLADITDSLTVLTGITHSVATVIEEAARELADVQAEIFPWLQALVEAQTADDPLQIADLLEYEIKPIVTRWGTVMRARAACPEALASEGDGPLSS